jgi:hypothetical protein
MDEHLKEELKELNNEVDRMKFGGKNLEFNIFHNAFASSFHFHFN